jgi:FMN phosphatase YigB (HAD superfamily)
MEGLGADKRLQALTDDLASGRYRVLSLDVFDTLLWRRVPEPRDLFFQIGNELLSQNLLLSWVSVAQFAELREAAEKAARAQAEAQTGSREVLLADIYSALPGHIWWDAKAPNAASTIEIATESAAMVLDHDVADLLDVAKRNGVRTVLTSDTYFTRNELTDFLTQAGLAAERIPETLYISNEHGRPKWRDLFDLVLSDLAESPSDVVHVGDNVDADVNPCAMRGMAHIFYDKWPALPRALKKEFPGQASRRANWMLSGGDHGLTGLRSRLAHRSPATIDKGHDPYWVYGATTLAPLFATYASWVAKTAAQENGAPVFGIMREGRFLSRLVGAVSKAMGRGVESGELWLSRRAVVRAALWSDDLSLLPHAVSYCPGPSSDDVLEQLGLSRSDLAGVFQDTNLFDIHAPGGVQAFLTGVSRSSDLRDKIVKYSERRRAALMTYLRGVLGNGVGGRIILLDLGYAGTIQTVLQKILQREDKPLSLTGLYIAINSKGRENVRAGVDLRALIGAEGFESGLTQLLERTPDILEHACMCPDGIDAIRNSCRCDSNH